MRLRESVPADAPSIAELHRDAFGEAEGATVAQLALDLLKDPTAQPLLSLVAFQDDTLAGHVIFSHITVDGNDIGACIMAPLAVAETQQKQGVGTRLIRHGLAVLRERGLRIVLVLGDPAYYTRAGFAAGHEFAPPHELAYPEAWMALALHDGALAGVSGTVKCADVLNSPEHW
ncbi:MAG: N-acetyltransferase [Gammaproteobacteria bacterium]|nr:N-acetyltransferase [Gammaproteobacteria bacterium]